MKIVLVTPAPPGSRQGNRNTATRWARFLKEAGHHVDVANTWDGRPADAMIALHARKSAAAIGGYAAAYPQRNLIVVLTGTDLYRDIHTDAAAQRSLEHATQLIVLQDRGVEELPAHYRGKTRVIYQSAPPMQRYAPLPRCFEVCVSGHLRYEKDPFRAAAAVAFLPAGSRIRISHIGAPMSDAMEQEARAWMAAEPRYLWLGEVERWRAARLLGRSRVMIISSRMEGGAHVVSEAIEAGVPVIASSIPGNVGMLGEYYPGYYPVGDERALAALLAAAEADAEFLARLEGACIARRPLISSTAERAALQKLLPG